MLNYEEKLECALAELEAAGIEKKYALPTGFGIARKLGFEPKPVLFFSTLGACLYHAVGFGVPCTGLIFLVEMWTEECHTIAFNTILGVGSGLMFGVLCVRSDIRSRRQHNLSRWDDL